MITIFLIKLPLDDVLEILLVVVGFRIFRRLYNIKEYSLKKNRRLFCKWPRYSQFLKKGSWSVHSINGDYLSFPEYTGSFGNQKKMIPKIRFATTLMYFLNTLGRSTKSKSKTHLFLFSQDAFLLCDICNIYDARLTAETATLRSIFVMLFYQNKHFNISFDNEALTQL